MKPKTVFVGVLIVLCAILLVQNSRMAALKFYFWTIYGPQFILVFLVFCFGFLVGFLVAKKGRKEDKKIPPPIPPKPQP